MKPFLVKPKRWWGYLNPFYWKRKRLMEAFMAYELEKCGIRDKLEKTVLNTYLYGDSRISMDWNIK